MPYLSPEAILGFGRQHRAVTLSTQVRLARRSAGDPDSARPAEIALKLLAAAMPLLAAALLLSRSG